jgi:hypothetical protein
MSTEITLKLADATYERAAHLARLTGRPIADVLAEAIDISLQPLGASGAMGTQVTPVAELADREVLAAANAQMEPVPARRLSELLERQQAGILTPDEHPELQALLQLDQDGLLRKAQALHEAVRRGLREPLEP